MITLLHDGTVDGLLTAVAEAAGAPDELPEVRALHDWRPALFEDARRVETNPHRAGRLLEELRAQGSRRVTRRVLHAAMSEQADVGRALAGYVRQVRRHGARADDFLADPSVGRVHEAARTAGRELHRLKGLVRFRRLRDGTLWGPIGPDTNVIAPLALYFRDRMPSEPWVLHDLSRGLAIRWDGHTLAWVDRDALPPDEPEPADEETEYQTLWQTYFRTIAVPERRNPRLQRQYMPVRYWPHLVEAPGAGETGAARSGARDDRTGFTID